ncbi:MAG: PEP/pyruvate-binding domain-containing protein [Candidatus Omnitrophota bacterium]
MPNKFIYTYDEAYAEGLPFTGAKAFNCAICYKTGFSVPDGVILNFQAYTAFKNKENLEQLYSDIKKCFPDNCLLIVRSSGESEDSAQASYAGQYLSLICQNETSEIKNACQACWKSGDSQNVKCYEQEISVNKMDKPRRMALLIQKVLSPISSGVCFSQDPNHPESKNIIINAVYGLAEALVSGEAVADQYEIDIDNENVNKVITGKQRHWRSPENPQQLSELPDKLSDHPVLNLKQIEEISRLAQKIKELFKYPVDIEWAYQENKLFVLQVRPITIGKTKQDEYILWTRDNVADVIPDVVTPFTWSVVNKATNQGFKNAVASLGLPPIEQDLFSLFDGRAYCNQTVFKQIYNVQDIKKHNPFILFKILFFYFISLIRLPFLVHVAQKRFPERLSQSMILEEKEALKDLREFLEQNMKIHVKVAISFELGTAILGGLIKKNMPNEKVSVIMDGLVTGLGKIESTAASEALWELASSIRKEKHLLEKIENSSGSFHGIISKYGADSARKWDDFLGKFGHQSLKEFELFYPRWAEDPSFVEITLKHYIAQKTEINFEQERDSRVQRRVKTENLVLKSIPLLFRFPTKFFIRHIQKCSIWREAIKQNIVKIMFQIRKQALSLSQKKKLETLNDIFFMTLDEACTKDSQIEQNCIDQRKLDWERLCLQEPFEQIRIYKSGREEKISHKQSPGLSLQGLALSSGNYTGIARVIKSKKDMGLLKAGEILVAASTNPSWTPLFAIAGAIVTDMGNYLSHGAIVAREIGIPAVGNLFTATRKIKTGQKIFVDADNGMIHVLEGVENEK